MLDVCADRIVTQSDRTKRAVGNVRIAGGVDAGPGPVIINPAAQTLASDGPGSLGVVRGTTTTPVANGAFTISTGGVRDDISGRGGMAPVTIAGSSLGSLLIGGVGLAPGDKYYIDPADGGGLVFTARPLFELLGQGPRGPLAIGLHSEPRSAFQLLGGTAGWSAKVGPPKDPWGLNMTLQYTGVDDAWRGEGDFSFPKLLGGGAKVSATLRSRKVDAVGVTIKAGQTGVPLGNSGFFFDSFAGEVSGLAVAPLKLALGVTGGWGAKIPRLGKRPLALEKARVSVGTDYSASVKGSIGLVDRRLAGGDLDVSAKLEPAFSASGRLNADVALLGTGYYVRGAVDLTSEHFTAAGGAELRVGGQLMRGASAIVSDEGSGATGTACLFGGRGCQTVGVGIRWRNAFKFPPEPEYIGADVERYRTVSASAIGARLKQRGVVGESAAATPERRSLRVAPRTTVLAVYGDPKGKTPADIELIAPGGRKLSLGHAGPRASVVRTDDDRVAFTVLHPRPGTWHIIQKAGATVRVQRVPPLGTIVAPSPTPRGTRKLPLKANRVVRLRWRISGDLPAKATVAVQRAATGGRGGVTIAEASARRRTLSIKASRLRKGINHLSLIINAEGVPFRRIAVPSTIYRR